MDELERRIAERLAGTAATPPGDLRERVVVAARRRRGRRRAALAGAVVAAAAVVAVPVAVLSAGAGPAPVTAAPARDVVVPRALPGGRVLRAMALGSDGSVLGVPTSVDGERVRITQRGVWLAGPADAAQRGPVEGNAVRSAPRRIADTGADSLPYLWTMAAGRSAYVWPDGTRLRCQSPGSAEVTTFPAGWDGHDRFYSDGDTVVWRDADRGGIATHLGCEGAARFFPVKGTLEAFSFPHAYVRSGRTVRQLDVLTGRTTDFTLPAGGDFTGGFGAGPRVLAWADEGVLTVQPLQPRALRREVRGLPHGRDASYLGRVTVGEHVVVFTAAHQDLDDASSLVYDLRTGKGATVRGEAWAAGPYLLTQEGGDYRLARP